MVKKSLINGLIAGVVMVALFALSFVLISQKNLAAREIVGYSSMVFALTAIFFGIKSYRDKVLGGKITFGKAFLLGIGISAVAALIFGIYVYVLYAVISPDLMDKLIDAYREKIKASGQTEQVIQQELAKFEEESKMWHNIYLMSFIMFMTVFLIGLLITLVSAAILKRREPLLSNT
jgi:uncharacterized membrane protein SpoIIM required for sporulation